MIFARSDWLLKLGIVSAIHVVLGFRHFSEKRELLGAGYPLVWFILEQLFTSVSVKSGRLFTSSSVNN